MHKLAAFGLLALVLGVNTSCEQQSYEETRMFNQSHKANTHGHGETHDAAKAGGHTDAGQKETKE